ncbi:helix-turn-helix transcriptional regulator [Kineothrix sp. MB12-C1]|uniref:helix-turn-helix transcriptional regulator n=1 Tax=Kineothrix sp. MB12-C1 TaxID=3070215 RepID=UPI0027D21F67|nr:AraC family transcriptional regulator [Kineothrix sp. MB12-C1]WMC93327.1 AraC family transcriptional regulator [Kineothrix sp. MB12-C1]
MAEKYQQPIEGFSRIVEGNYEIVHFLTGSTIRIWYNQEAQDFSSHWHPAMEIIMPVENIYTVTIHETKFVLNPNDILIIPAGELHHLMAPPCGARLIYMFDFSVISKIKGFSSLLPFLAQPILINQETYPLYYTDHYQLLLKIRDEYFSDNNLREPLIYSHLINFFVHLGRSRINTDMAFPYIHTTKRKDLIEKLNIVFDYLDTHYRENLTLDSVADIAGFSKFHFTRLFKQCSGQNFYDYLCYKRIKSAELLLVHPEITITEIALQSGFSSISTFNRTFKKLKNCTPSEYRALYCANY